MKLTKLEQSGFIFETEKGFRLAIDIGNKIPIEKLYTTQKVDACIASHIHGDHFDIENIKALRPKNVYLNSECLETLGEENFEFKLNTIKSGETISIGEIIIQIFSVDHGPNVSAPLAENFGFLITIDDQKIYFAGDMFYASGIDVSLLEVGYALVPVGTFYTFGPEEAFAFAKKFKKIGKIISMHYEKIPETREQFLELAKGEFEVE
jgi:L-ascorbate metabolism protein UlaG (beta-lactamase superfamily)